MVKEERREDDVHAPIAEGKPERVGDDGGSARGEPRMRRLPVEAEDADVDSRFGGRRQEVATHVPRAAAEVEDLECVLPPGQRREKRLGGGPGGGPAATPELTPHPRARSRSRGRGPRVRPPARTAPRKTAGGGAGRGPGRRACDAPTRCRRGSPRPRPPGRPRPRGARVRGAGGEPRSSSPLPQRDRPLRRMSAEFFEPKAIPLQSANSTWAGRATFGT